MAKPLFKWTGGKGRLLTKYEDLGFFPQESEFDTFVDLFAGGGAVSCWVADRYPTKPIVLNDLNDELVLVYQQIRDNWTEFKSEYQRTYEVFLNTTEDRRKALYNCYKKRYCWNYKHLTEAQLAANLLVMLKINFNGIWLAYIKYGHRYSTAPGHINYKESVFDLSNVEEFREMLLRAQIHSRSFEDVPVPDNSWVFADPPYRETGKMYSDHFDDVLQAKLADHLKGLASRGCLIAESNKEIGDGFWSDHFPEFQINFLDHKYTCGHGGAVNPVTEVLIKNYGEPVEANDLTRFF